MADSGVSNLAAVGVTLAVSRLYHDPAILGRVVTLLTIASIGIMLGDFGNGQASTLLISRHLAGLGGHSPGKTAATGLLQALGSGLLLGLSVLLVPDAVAAVARFFHQTDHAHEILDLRPLINLVGLWIFFAVLLQQTNGIFAGFQKMQYAFFQDVSIQIPRLAICLAVAVPLLPWHYFIWGWTAWYLVAAAIGLTLLVHLLRQGHHRLTLAPYAPLAHFRTGASLFSSSAAGFILYYLAFGIIWWMKTGQQSYSNVGFFAPLWSLTRGYEVLLMPLAIALLPAVSDAHGTRDIAVLEKLVRRSLLMTGLAAVTVLVIFATVPSLLLGLFGSAYQPFVITLIVLAFGVAFEAQRCALDPVLNGSGLARWVTVIEWSKFGLFCLLGIPLYRVHFLTGIALAFVGAFLPAWAAKVLLIRTRLKIHILGPAILLAVLLTAVATVALVCRWSMIDFKHLPF